MLTDELDQIDKDLKCQDRAWYKDDYTAHWTKYLLARTKSRAKEKGLDFDLEVSDICVPKYCPVLGYELEIRSYDTDDKRKKHFRSPSIDRIDNSKGYVKGNIQIISDKANTMKNNATRDELLKFAFWIYKTYLTKETI